jgi:GR25 family glycosyltransferase involved in LPS biosynthesis
LVLEDDALKILPGFEYIVSDLMKKLPDDWDIFLLGFKTLKDTCQQINDDIYKVKDFVLFHSYIINKKGAKKLLDNLPVNAPVDTFVSSISDKVNIYRHNMTRKKESKKRKTSYLISQHNSGSFIKHTNIEDKNISLKDFFKSN